MSIILDRGVKRGPPPSRPKPKAREGTTRYFDLGWLERRERGHAVIITPRGRRGFQATFGIGAVDPRGGRPFRR